MSGERSELGAFLRSRRARLRPEDVGLPSYGRRRVPGLRREELAQLAGVSVDYYVRLEQGRVQHPSDGVLDAIADALRLDDDERSHLHDLVGTRRPLRRAPRPQRRVRPELRALLDAMTNVPAFVLGHRMDVLAWNELASALVADFAAIDAERRNMAWLAFLDEDSRHLYPDWDQVARDTVGFLRLAAGRHPEDTALAALIGELSVKSDDFRRWWASHHVRAKTHGTKRMVHPLVGELTLHYETLAVSGDPDQSLVTYTAKPGSASERALTLLASLAAGRRERAEAPAARPA